MGRDLLAYEESSPTYASRQPRDLLSNEEPEEGLGTSLMMALPRVAEDVGAKANEFFGKLPGYYEKAKTEVPALFDLKGKHNAHRVGQAAAGGLEAANAAYQLPISLNKYFEDRLHLAPKGSNQLLQKMFPSAQGLIEKGFDQPKYPGEALTRQWPAVVPAVNSLARLTSKLSKLSPSNAFRGNLTPEELQNNLRITQGTETGLGDVIGSPWLKRMQENVISKVPFSGVTESMQRNAGKIINKGHNIIDEIGGGRDISNLDQHLNDALKESYDTHQFDKNAGYKEVNDIANKIKLKLDLPNFAKEASKHKNAIEDTNILKYEPEMQKLMQKIGKYENPVKSETATGKIVDEFGKPLINETTHTYPTLEEANLLKGKLNELSRQHGSSPSPSDRHLAKVFGGLSRTLKSDIQNAIEKSGHEGLKGKYQQSEQYYAKKFSPFLDKQIYKFINGNADPETLVSSFIKTGKSTDRANLINKLNQKLPKEDRNLLGYTYLQRAMDENNVLNPMKLKTLLSKNALGNKQFEALFPDPITRNALRDYVKLVGMNTKGLKLMENPETGQMAMDLLPLLSKSPAKLAAKLIGAPYVGKKLSSEATRTKLVNKMIKKSK